MSRSLFLLIGLIMLALVPRPSAITPAGAQEPQDVSDPGWTNGDRWTWKMPEGTEITWVVSSVSQDQYLLSAHGPKDETVIIRVGRNPAVLTAAPVVGPGNPLLQLEFPLTVGHRSTRYASGTTAGGMAANTWRTDWIVAKTEQVTVPAGSFNAYRLDGTQCNLTMNSCGTVHAWYAPQAKNIVQIAWGSENYWVSARRGKATVLTTFQVH
jgi:hypothetical protein